MAFGRNDLVYNHYKWPDGSPSFEFTGEPTRRMFDRYNGSQVLFIINSYAAILGHFTAQIGQQLEDMISNSLPLDKKSEISVFNWINENFGLQKAFK